ncbi:MAG TPA: diguanylate cyclase [Gemmataceae bacterium]|nr:diguanylate cyclase [Gemmataceae bacterium]
MPLLHATRFDELKAGNQLPSPTGVALAILRLAESETTSAQEIARVLQTDPALSGRVLKIANSAYSGRSRPATSVREAVTHLGVRTVRNVALGFSLVSQCGRGACRGFDYGGFWSRSLAMAVAAQSVAHHSGHVAPAEAFTCGLLGQVGRLALASIYPDEYTEVLERAGPDNPRELCRLERERFATDHNELTGAMLRDWGLPESCVEAARHHENCAESGLPEGHRILGLARLLSVASEMAAVCVAGDEGRAPRVLGLFAASEEVGIAADELIELCDHVVAEWQDWGRILQVETQEVPPFAELAGRAREASDAPAVEAVPVVVIGEAGGPLSIVVADDNPVELLLLSDYLRTAGHNVHPARDGAEALRLVLEVNPQMVITDWVMPEMDGAALVKALRQTKMGRQFYVIMLTGSQGEDAQVEAFAAGADDYMVKPFSPKLLAARLRACARLVRLQEETRRDKEELRRCMAELGVANRKLQQAALTDALTGLYNRRYALERLEQEWAGVTRSGQPLACMVLDIDHFKRVNDSHGHDVGDRVLEATAKVLRRALRQSDVVCRLGGEEFIVIGSGMDRNSARVCAERLRSQAEGQVIEVAGAALRVTLSIGVAVRTADTASPTELLKAADQAMYAAKQGGRNRVFVAAAGAA